MDIGAFENFLFVPSSASGVAGRVYELQRSSGFEKNSFVLLPYQNPQTTAVTPRFFKIKNTIAVDALAPTQTAVTSLQLKAGTSRQDYLKNVIRLKEHIQQGNIYEINYCVQFVAEEADIDPVRVFYHLHQLAKAPYSALLKIGDEFILCASPELFLEKKGNTISTKPIKGTIRRGNTPEEDEALKNALYTSIKERTENVMAVDVARNDLSQFAGKGSVQVNQLYNIETFETVHQMVSTVRCEIKEGTTFEKITAAAFPMASMTGAPKLRAMQLIDEFEDFKRNYYSGAMGLIDEHEDFTLSVNIRSIFYDQRTRTVSIAVGGAITHLSDPEQEYEECLLKAGALLRALGARIVE